ncbi:hypothetical protein M422DRAFT_52454 [Sphaerobolus stellatus SS14]|uniref:Uncharacterized protein n=1 Tax=Sphaerobolus stellatus (strain SS14) TaxID=990650 RepID=A0A0C9UVZ3_SPHS4|nr:hypothetical protein M422DRAFT_52454 [Sphaerobolus stellatus SS14]
MSDASEIAAISYSYRSVNLQAAIVEAYVNGLYSVIVWGTMYILYRTPPQQTQIQGIKARQTKKATLILVPYFASTVHLAFKWELTRLSFLVNGDTSDDIFNSLLAPPLWLRAFGSALLVFNMLLADSIIIWRCWTVWGRNWLAIVFPLLWLIVEIVFGILSLIAQDLPSVAFANNRIDVSSVYFSASLATTVVSTLLIVSRIYYVTRRNIRKYSTTLEIIVESAALYSLNLIILVPLIVGPTYNGAYLQAILMPMTGIAPTLILARVSLGWSRPDSYWTSVTTSNVETGISLPALNIPSSLQDDSARSDKDHVDTLVFGIARKNAEHNTGSTTVVV